MFTIQYSFLNKLAKVVLWPLLPLDMNTWEHIFSHWLLLQHIANEEQSWTRSIQLEINTVTFF
jgi:hypothetical protein